MILNASKLWTVTFNGFFVRTRNTFHKTQFFTILSNNRFLCTVNGNLKVSSLDNSNDFSSVQKFNSLEFVNIPLFFESTPEYSNLIFKPNPAAIQLNQNCRTSQILMEINSEITTSSVLDELTNVLKEDLRSLEFENLLEIMSILFTKFKGNESDTWFNVINIINEELVCRGETVSLNEIFKCMYMLSRSFLYRKFSFYFFKRKTLSRKVGKLNHQEFILYIYLIKASKIVKFETEKALANFIPNLKPEELFVIAKFYQLHKTVPKEPEIAIKIFDKLFELMFDPNSVYLGQVFNVLSIINKKPLTNSASNFFAKLEPLQGNLDPRYLAYCIMIKLRYGYLNQDMLNSAMKRIKENIELLSFYLLERLTFSLAVLNFKDEKFLELAISRFESVSFITPSLNKHKVAFLKNLILFEKYPEKLIKSVITEDYLSNLVSSDKSSQLEIHKWSYVNRCLALDCPELHCSTDNKKYLKAHNFWVCNERETIIRQIFKLSYDIEDILFKNFGQDKVKSLKLLKQYPRILLMKFNKKNLQAEPISEEEIKNLKELHDYFFIGIMLASKDYYSLDDTYNFVSRTIIRHFAAIGCSCLFVPINTFMFEHKNQQGDTFILNLMKNKLQELNIQDTVSN